MPSFYNVKIYPILWKHGISFFKFTKQLATALIKNAKPTPKRKTGRPSTESTLDISFSPKSPEKQLVWSKFQMIFNLMTLNIGLFTGVKGQDVSYVNRKAGGVVKNAKKDYI